VAQYVGDLFQACAGTQHALGSGVPQYMGSGISVRQAARREGPADRPTDELGRDGHVEGRTMTQE
jgi:hypothetical protein